MKLIQPVDFTAGDLINVVREVAQKNPTTTYDADVDGINGSCVNFKDGAPSCIIGHGLYRLGVTGESLGRYAGDTEVFSVLEVLNIEGTDKQADWLTDVQSEQDFGHSWLDAVKHADEMIKDNERRGFYDS